MFVERKICKKFGINEAGSESRGTKDPGTFVNRVAIIVKKIGFQVGLEFEPVCHAWL